MLLSIRSRFLSDTGRMSRSALSRRFLSDMPKAASTPAVTPSNNAQPATKPASSSDYQDVIPIPKQRGPPKMRDGYSGGFYISLLGVAIVSTPIITYLYWEHRKDHMRTKKEAMLKEIQARAKASP